MTRATPTSMWIRVSSSDSNDNWKDPSLLFLPTNQLECSEENRVNSTEDDDDDTAGTVLFSCTIDNQRLVFNCRDRSSGVLIQDEPVASPDESSSGAVNPFFFDKGYTLLASTGFQIWPGARFITEALLLPSLLPVLRSWQEKIRTEAPYILELGSGVGATGISLASAGARVLLTGLPTLVTNSVQINIKRNSNKNKMGEVACCWPTQTGVVPIGRGWAGSAVLDWTRSLQDQLNPDHFQLDAIDLVVSSDCLLLLHLMEHVLDIVGTVFAYSPRAKFLFSYQRRSPNPMYTTLENVIDAIQKRTWKVECVAWRPICCGKFNDGQDEINDLLLLEVEAR